MTTPEDYRPLQCTDYLYRADQELQATNKALEALDLSHGLRATIPQAVKVAAHAFNAYVSALQALTVGTRTNP